jgi:Tfp pilus assembly protein PilF
MPAAFVVLLLLILALPLAPAIAAPFLPQSDAQVLETLPARFDAPGRREMRELRRALSADPRNLPLALRLARRYYDEVAAEGDPRYIGYAQAALAPWWDLSDPPPAARVMRAVLLQFNHHFDAAIADLRAAVQAEPDNGEAWAWLAAVSLVRADHALAREACARLQPLAGALIGSACAAQIQSLSGQPAAAAAELRRALQRYPQADAAQQLWALTRLAEAEERRGDAPAAEAAYRRALDLGITDGFLLAAYADFLLDHARPAEVLALLKEQSRSDLLLLRLALAAKAHGDPALAAWQDALSARFHAARLRGDTVHQKEEARFALAVLGQPQRAVQLAGENFAVQREPADARILLEAALAAGQPAAAQPALRWRADTGFRSPALDALAAALEGKR